MSDVNQCDGCRQGLRLVDGLHYNGSGRPWISCTADRYGSPTPPSSPSSRAPAEEGEREIEAFCAAMEGDQWEHFNEGYREITRAKVRRALASGLASRAPAEDRGARERERIAAERTKADWRYGYLRASEVTRDDAETLATDVQTAVARVESCLTTLGSKGSAGAYLSNESLLAVRRVLEEYHAAMRSCDCATLREQLVAMREEQRAIAALFGIEPCHDDRPATWVRDDVGSSSLEDLLRPLAAALLSPSQDAAGGAVSRRSVADVLREIGLDLSPEEQRANLHAEERRLGVSSSPAEARDGEEGR